MKNVCRWLGVVVMVCWCINTQSALALCFLEDLECLAPMLLPGYQKDVGDGHTLREWAPSAGKMYAFNDWIIAEFRFDQESIDILHGNNSFGLEFEAVIKGPNRNQVDVRWIYTTFPANAGVGYDTEVCDYVTNHGSESKVVSVHVLNPSVLQKGVNYRVFFKLENRLPNSGISIKPGVQITIDVNYGPLLANLVVEQIPWLDQFQYYALETEHYIKFDIQPDQINGVCWDDKEDSYDCSIGTGDNPPAIYIEGNHTHIIHDDYRCSKETNGPILCWESGLDPNEADGRRNCWNAWKWYQFNGEVGEVAEHRTDSAWITTRDRNMCAEVYNSNGNSGGGNNGGSGYTDDSGDSNPWAGYVHHVGLKYMKIGKKSSGHWSGSKTWTVGEIPSKRDFRIKLKQKGGVWPDGDTCTEVWFSHNKHFTGEDLFLKRKCKNLSDETEDEKSIYVKDVHLPSMEVGKNYYFFTVVTYPGGANSSSEGDHDEYVKVEIADNPTGDNSSNNQTSWDNLPDATKAAIMSIILD